MGENSSLKAVQTSRLRSRIAELEEQNNALHTDKEALSTQLAGLRQSFDNSSAELTQVKLVHRQQLAALHDEAAKLKTQLSDAHAAAAEAGHHVEAAKAEVNALLAAREGGSNALRAEVSKLEAQLATKTKEVTTLSRKLGAADCLADALEQELKALQQGLGKVTNRLQAQEGGLKQQEARLLEVTKVGEQLAEQLEAKTAALEAAQQHSQDLQQQKAAADALHQQNTRSLQEQVQELQQQLQAAQTERDDLQEKLALQTAEAAEQLQKLTNQLQQAQDNEMDTTQELNDAKQKLAAQQAAAAMAEELLKEERNAGVLAMVCLHQATVSLHTQAAAAIKAAAVSVTAAQGKALREAREAAAAYAAAAAARDATAAAQALLEEAAGAAAEAKAALAVAVKAEAAAKADATVARAEAAQAKQALQAAVEDADRAFEEAAAATVEADAARAAAGKAMLAATAATAATAAAVAVPESNKSSQTVQAPAGKTRLNAMPAAAQPAAIPVGAAAEGKPTAAPMPVAAGAAQPEVLECNDHHQKRFVDSAEFTSSKIAGQPVPLLATTTAGRVLRSMQQQQQQHPTTMAAFGAKRPRAAVEPAGTADEPAAVKQKTVHSDLSHQQQQQGSVHANTAVSVPAVMSSSSVAPHAFAAGCGPSNTHQPQHHLQQQQQQQCAYQSSSGNNSSIHKPRGLNVPMAATPAAAPATAIGASAPANAQAGSSSDKHVLQQRQQQQPIMLPSLKVPAPRLSSSTWGGLPKHGAGTSAKNSPQSEQHHSQAITQMRPPNTAGLAPPAAAAATAYRARLATSSAGGLEPARVTATSGPAPPAAAMGTSWKAVNHEAGGRPQATCASNPGPERPLLGGGAAVNPEPSVCPLRATVNAGMKNSQAASAEAAAAAVSQVRAPGSSWGMPGAVDGASVSRPAGFPAAVGTVGAATTAEAAAAAAAAAGSDQGSGVCARTVCSSESKTGQFLATAVNNKKVAAAVTPATDVVGTATAAVARQQAEAKTEDACTNPAAAPAANRAAATALPPAKPQQAAAPTSAMGMLFCALADDSDADEDSSQQSARGLL